MTDISPGFGSSSGTFSDTQKPSIFVCVKQSKKEVFVDSRVDGLFTYEIIEGINRGFTSCIEYTVDLWKERTLWFAQLIQRKKFAFFIDYDLWNKEYRVKNIYGDVMSSADFEDVLYKVCMQDNVSLCATNILESNKIYYITTKIVLKPLATENLNEVLHYAMGEIREVKKKEKTGFFLHLLGQAKNLAGLGDKVIVGKSKKFKYEF